MPPKHLTPSDVKFFGSMSPDRGDKLAAIVELAEDLDAAAQAAGIEADWESVLALEDDDIANDPDRLDAIRGELRARSAPSGGPSPPQNGRTTLTNEHESLNHSLSGLASAWAMAAHQHGEAAERARADKENDLARFIGIHDEHRGRLERKHDDIISRHESQARVYGRRAEHAKRNLLLSSPDETADSAYQHEHGPLVAMAMRCGRCRQVDDSVA